MLNKPMIGRRTFVQTLAVTGVGLSRLSFGFEPNPNAPAIYKTLKYNMIGVDGSVEDKFRAAKEAGFQGVELDSPGVDVEAVRAAIVKVGLPVDGSVCSTHWSIRHTSPDAAQRAQALEDLKTALRQTHAVGGHTVLLVVGHGDDGPENEIWARAVDNIRKALPLAAELGVYIAVENVWNKFMYDHNGGPDQTADKFCKFVDEFNSPWIGMQFDIGNHWKYGDPAAWIRTLGKRVVKLDIKGFSRVSGKFTRITDCDINWQTVREALKEIGFAGWCAAEVDGGNTEKLKSIAAEIDSVLGLA
jgi:L-ribulose-5-phosphate 3-epimerase